MPGALALLVGGRTQLVTPNGNDVLRVTLSPTDCFAGVRYGNDGTEQANASNGSEVYNVSRGNWLDGGDPANVWIERIINSGTLNNSDPGAGRLQLSTTRTYSIIQDDLGIHTCNLTLNFYNAASGGILLATTTYTLEASVEI